MAEGKAGFHKKRTHQSKFENKDAKPKDEAQPAEPAKPSCPECGSKRNWKDGLRYPRGKGKPIQRYICRECGYRFSETSQNSYSNDFKPSEHDQKVHTLILKTPNTISYSCPENGCGRENPWLRGETEPQMKRKAGEYQGTRAIAIIKAKNVAITAKAKKRAAGATEKITEAEVKGKIVEYMWRLKNNGYADCTVEGYVRILKILAYRGADLWNPESVKHIIRIQPWSIGRKAIAVHAYKHFAKMFGISWEPPNYKPPDKLPFIPTEKEINDLIAGCSTKIAAFLQLLKETGMRAGEAFNLKWTDLDTINNTVRITPEKGSNPRIFKISNTCAAMLNRLPKNSERIFNYRTKPSLRRTFEKQRKRIAHKLGNPRLIQIHFHTLRHWKATMEYHRTKDILHVMQLLGHKNIKYTLKYTQLVNFRDDEYICKVARKPKEIKELIEVGFEYVTEQDGLKFFRKRK